MFMTRLISGIILVAAALAVIISGGSILALVLLALSLIGMFELYRAVGIGGRKMLPVTAVMYLGAAVYYLLLRLNTSAEYSLAVITGSVIVVMAVYVFAYPRFRSEQIMPAVFGLLYVAVMLSFIYRTRCLTDGEFSVWLIFLSSWGCDTCAYCVGMLLGKHKMSPKLSPKKSIEGAVGGVAGAAALGAVYALATGRFMTDGNAPVWEYALVCAVGALISMVGDLAASAIKRNHDIKDYGKLIPGHGGVLDRFDSVIFTAPVIWILAALVLKV